MSTDELESTLRGFLQGEFSNMTINFNDHASEYIDAREALRIGRFQFVDWANDEEKEKAIGENSVWTIQWYPVTPIGFCKVGASSLKACVDAMAKKLPTMTFIP